MGFSFIDWSVIGGVFLILIIATYITKKYTTSVADFLSANRCAGRYLLTVSSGMAAVGAISIVGGFRDLWRMF